MCTNLNKSLYSHKEIHKILGCVEILDIVHKTHPPTVIFRSNLHKNTVCMQIFFIFWLDLIHRGWDLVQFVDEI